LSLLALVMVKLSDAIFERYACIAENPLEAVE
jgi:hypothetical protein